VSESNTTATASPATPAAAVPIGDSVRQRQARAEGSAYRQRLSYMESGDGLVGTDPDSQAMASNLEVVRNPDNTISVYMHSLASGDHVFSPPEEFRNPLDYWLNEQSANSVGDARYEMRKAVYYWKRDPLVFRCTRLLMQMANAEIRTECENEDFGKLVANWLDQVTPYTFKEQFFLEFFRTHFIPIIKTLIPYVPRNYRDNKTPATNDGNVDAPLSAMAAKDEEARQQRTESLVAAHAARLDAYREAWAKFTQASEQLKLNLISETRYRMVEQTAMAAQYEWTKGMIPGGYITLDPMSVSIEGPANMSWLRMPFLEIDGELAKAIRNPTPEQMDIVSALPVELVTKVRAGQQKVWLSPNVCDIVTCDKMSYEKYPTPIARHCFDALDNKIAMQAMDKATIKSVRNRILLVKIGTDKFPETDHRKILRVKQMLSTPGNNLTLFWNHAISMEWIEPKLDSLLDEKKFNGVNDEIRTAYGVSRVLTGTSESAGAIGNSVMNFKGVQQEVLNAQKKYLEWLHRQIDLLRTALGVKWTVTCTFDSLNMQDPVKFLALLNAAVQQGIIDHQTAIETFGFHFPTIAARMKKMKKYQKDGLFLPIPSANNMGPGGQNIKNGGGTPTKGKPANQPLADNNQNKKGTSQPKLKAAAVVVQNPKVPGKPILVIDADIVSEEAKADSAQMFGCDKGDVMGRQEYQQAFGSKVNFWHPWPELDMRETMAAMHEGEELFDKVVVSVKEKEKSHRAQAANKRGRYVSTELHQTFLAEAFKVETEKFLGTKFTEISPEEVRGRVNEVASQISASPMATAKVPEQIIAMATAVIRQRYNKFLADREAAPAQ